MVSRPALASSAFVYTSDVAILESCGLCVCVVAVARPLAPSDGTCAWCEWCVRQPVCAGWTRTGGTGAAAAPMRCIVAVSHSHTGSHGIDAGHV